MYHGYHACSIAQASSRGILEVGRDGWLIRFLRVFNLPRKVSVKRRHLVRVSAHYHSTKPRARMPASSQRHQWRDIQRPEENRLSEAEKRLFPLCASAVLHALLARSHATRLMAGLARIMTAARSFLAPRPTLPLFALPSDWGPTQSCAGDSRQQRRQSSPRARAWLR